MIRIPNEALAAPIQGRRLRGDTLQAELAGAPALLVFLRHLG